MIQRSTLQLLRFHFSFFLLPVYLFALGEANRINTVPAVLVFGILHLLVYPSSNGYNSYMDRDTTPVGGLERPMQPTRQLFVVSLVLDAIALLLSLSVSVPFVACILVYILASRAYSYRGIRLKQYPIIGFLTVFLCQGALIFFSSYGAITGNWTSVPLLPCVLSSLLIGALYPLTQVYQHEADEADGVRTISMLVGKRGSFVLSMVLFLLAALGFYLHFRSAGRMNHFLLFLLVLLPVVLFFLYWMAEVWKKEEAANFKNSFRMNLVATLCTTIYFITLIILNH